MSTRNIELANAINSRSYAYAHLMSVIFRYCGINLCIESLRTRETNDLRIAFYTTVHASMCVCVIGNLGVPYEPFPIPSMMRATHPNDGALPGPLAASNSGCQASTIVYC